MDYRDYINEQPSSLETNTARFSGAPWFDMVKNKTVTIAGVGGIGSWLSLLMARMKPWLMYIIDPDEVSSVNMAGQLYCGTDIGKSKVGSMADVIHQFASYYPQTSRNSLTDSTEISPVLMCGFDNMSARSTAYYLWKKKLEQSNDKDKYLYIDGRLAAEKFQIFCITGEDNYYMEQYEKDWLFSDEEADSAVCSYKQTTYCATMIASFMTNLFVNWCTNQCDPLMARSLPFLTEYSADQMYFKCEV